MKILEWNELVMFKNQPGGQCDGAKGSGGVGNVVRGEEGRWSSAY